MAQLYFRYSTMGAGKSIEVQKVAFNYEERGQNPLIFTSSLDNRFADEGVVASRMGLKRRAISVNDEMNMFEVVKEYNDLFGVDAVIIDESQFLLKHHVEELTDIVDELNIPVMCYGLRADFRNELFEGSYWLLALADKIEEIKTICWCGKKALTNARIIDGKVVYTGEQIFIGGNESYIPLCRKHYKQGKVMPYKEKSEDLIMRYEKLKKPNIKYKINAVYFSATGTTQKTVKTLADELSIKFDEKTINYKDVTLPAKREESLHFTDEDIVIVGIPVYAGRVPNVLLNYLKNNVKADGAKAVALVLYGNRNYDDALIELKDILAMNGFNVIAAGAFIGEHSFSNILAKNRPDEKDLEKVCDFAKQIYTKICSDNLQLPLIIPGNKDYRPYYKPKDKNGNSVDIRKVTPKTNSDCTDCKLCVSVCPMGSIDYDDVAKLNYICIKCGACIKICPVSAKYYDDESYLNHKHELEVEFAERKEPEVFL